MLAELAQATQPWDLSRLFSLPAMAAPPSAAPPPVPDSAIQTQARVHSSAQVAASGASTGWQSTSAAQQLDEAISLLMQLAGSSAPAGGASQQPNIPPVPLLTRHRQPSSSPAAVSPSRIPRPRPLPRPAASAAPAARPAAEVAGLPTLSHRAGAASGPVAASALEQPLDMSQIHSRVDGLSAEGLSTEQLPAHALTSGQLLPATSAHADAPTAAQPAPGLTQRPAKPAAAVLDTASAAAATSHMLPAPEAPEQPSPAESAKSLLEAGSGEALQPAEQQALQATLAAASPPGQAPAGPHAEWQSREAAVSTAHEAAPPQARPAASAEAATSAADTGHSGPHLDQLNNSSTAAPVLR